MSIVTVTTTLIDLAVPGCGTVLDALGLIFNLCNGVGDGRDSCRRLYQRLVELLNELTKMESEQRLPSSEALGRYTAMLVRYIQYLRRYSDQSLVARVMRHQQMMDEQCMLNEEVDILLQMLNLATMGSMIDWRKQWEIDRLVQQEKMDLLVSNDLYVLNELREVRAQMDAMAQLKFQIEQREAEQSKETLGMMKKLLSAIVRTSRAQVPIVPPWFLPEDEIAYDKEPFARGSFGAVHHGVWGSGTKVVVKTLQDVHGSKDVARAKFMEEATIWSKLHHPHVVKMFGGSHIAVPPFIVCEDATNGTLGVFLADSETNKNHMWELLYQAALGLEYLHKMGIIHGDLKLNNILVGSDGQAKLADFGLSTTERGQGSASSRAPCQSTASTFASGGGCRWRAPESLLGEANATTVASDVYSFAMCIIEAATGQPPYAFLDDASVVDYVLDGQLPDQPDELGDEAWALVQSMTALDPVDRLPLSEVVQKLELLMRKARVVQRRLRHRRATCVCGSQASVAANSCRACGRAMSIRVSASPTSEPDSAPDTDREPTTTSPSSATTKIAQLVQMLIAGSNKQRDQAAYTLASLSVHPDNRDQIADAGGIPPFVSLLVLGTEIQKQHAAAALANLAFHDDNKKSIAAAGGIAPLVFLLRDGASSEIQRQNAAAALASLAVDGANKTRIAAQAGSIVAFISLVENGTDTQKEYGAAVLANLSLNDPSNQTAIATAGGISPLVWLVVHGNGTQKQYAAIALSNLSVHNDNKKMMAMAGATKALMAVLVHSRDSTHRHHAAAALAHLASEETNRKLIVSNEESGIAFFVSLLLDDDSDGGGTITTTTETLKLHAAHALTNLAVDDKNKKLIVEASGIAPLIALLRFGTSPDHKRFAAIALARLARMPSVAVRIVAVGGKSVLYEMAIRGDSLLTGGAGRRRFGHHSK